MQCIKIMYEEDRPRGAAINASCASVRWYWVVWLGRLQFDIIRYQSGCERDFSKNVFSAADLGGNQTNDT